MFCSIDPYVCLYASTTLFIIVVVVVVNIVALKYVLKLGSVSPPTLSFFKIILAIQWPLGSNGF